VSVLDWCKLFGDPKSQQGWHSVVSDKAKFQAELLRKIGLTEQEFENFRLKMREYRDKFVAHLDSDLTAFIPLLDVAKNSVDFFFEYLIDNEIAAADLSGLPDSAEKFRLGYEQSLKEAELVYRKCFP